MVHARTCVFERPATRGLFIIGKHLIWRFSRQSPNRQIKNLAKFSRYTVSYTQIYRCKSWRAEANEYYR